LSLIGFDFKVLPAVIDESHTPGESPQDYVTRLAALKAHKVHEQINPGSVVVAADTTVVYSDQILGKPRDVKEARAMLTRLRGEVHQVYTSITVAVNRQILSDLCGSNVPMRLYSDEELDGYIFSGDPFDKAGGYGIQHAGFHPVENFRDCFANVMGLPLCHLTRTLRKLDLEPKANVPVACQGYIGYQCKIYQHVLSEKI
jgi:MAF protein